MPKIKRSPPIHQHYRKPNNVEKPKPQNRDDDFRENGSRNISPHNLNSSREGFDYGSYKKYEIEDYYEKGKKGKKYVKGNNGKRAALEEAIEEAIQKALEEQAILEELKQEALKQEEIKQEQIREEVKRDDIKDTEQDSTLKKDTHKKELLHNERHTPHETQRG